MTETPSTDKPSTAEQFAAFFEAMLPPRTNLHDLFDQPETKENDQ